MSENENRSLLPDENERVQENAMTQDIPEAAQPEQPDLPQTQAAEDNFEAIIYPDAEAEASPSEPVNEADAPAASADTFNPYAPRNDGEEANQGIGASYTNPINSQRPQRNSGYPTNYSYNNNGYSNDSYYNPPENRGGGKKLITAAVIICVIVAAIALISSFFGSDSKPSQSGTATTADSILPTETTAPTTAPVVSSTTTSAQAQTNESTTLQSTTQQVQTTAPVINSIWVAEKVRPSVVGVLAYKQGELAGEGSGVLMSESADKNYTYVVTCAHVINDPGCEFAILLLDDTGYEAEVVALDERTDIGVLRVKATGLPLAEFGDSASLKVGEPIYAIGNPGGSEYFGSITNGIVASIDRSISATYTMTCIQHNAAINPGNSGGALVNTAGQVIGINSSKIAKTDYEGMGFAVPSAIFTSVVDSLIKYGYVPNRPELGIRYAAVSDYQLYSIIVSIKGLPKGSIVIAEIPQGSALQGTGAQVGDLITAVNGKDMDSADVLLDLIDTGAVGDELTLTLCRIEDRSYDITTFDVTVKLVENKGSVTTTTQAQTLPQQDDFGAFGDFFGDFFGW